MSVTLNNFGKELRGAWVRGELYRAITEFLDSLYEQIDEQGRSENWKIRTCDKIGHFLFDRVIPSLAEDDSVTLEEEREVVHSYFEERMKLLPLRHNSKMFFRKARWEEDHRRRELTRERKEKKRRQQELKQYTEEISEVLPENSDNEGVIEDVITFYSSNVDDFPSSCREDIAEGIVKTNPDLVFRFMEGLSEDECAHLLAEVIEISKKGTRAHQQWARKNEKQHRCLLNHVRSPVFA